MIIVLQTNKQLLSARRVLTRRVADGLKEEDSVSTSWTATLDNKNIFNPISK